MDLRTLRPLRLKGLAKKIFYVVYHFVLKISQLDGKINNFESY